MLRDLPEEAARVLAAAGLDDCGALELFLDGFADIDEAIEFLFVRERAEPVVLDRGAFEVFVEKTKAISQ